MGGDDVRGTGVVIVNGVVSLHSKITRTWVDHIEFGFMVDEISCRRVQSTLLLRDLVSNA